ncbi:DoxX family protein [Planobispora takensis]|uniref:DoxX family protein n=1 Tax=Planobispora takensis TaxID=1367882 RepID=A0A8J3SPJ8_9ACTN|nr:DoxX family protein [Planobispora takensis]GIH98231.1 hypothetical protein Pta02_02400 [Planobispora takensis]
MTATHTARPATARTVRAPGTGGARTSTSRRVLWVLQVLIAVFLIAASALPKFVGEQNAITTFELIGWGQWFRYVTGVVELAGGIGLLIPRLAGVASIGLIGLMAGAAATQILVLEPAWALLPVGFAVVFALVARDRRDQTRALVRSLAGRR